MQFATVQQTELIGLINIMSPDSGISERNKFSGCDATEIDGRRMVWWWYIKFATVECFDGGCDIELFDRQLSEDELQLSGTFRTFKLETLAGEG